jgi:hypothetical protein
MLFDSNDYIKLGDFDRFIKVEERLDFNIKPFARLLGKKGG